MKSVVIGIISAGTGAMIAVAVMMGVFSVSPFDAVKGEQMTALTERVRQSESLLLKISKNISSIEQYNKLMSDSSQLVPDINSPDEVDASNERLGEKKIKLKTKVINNVADKKREALISRLNDTSYTSSKTMSDFMSSDEFYNISAISRKKVVEEMVKKLNDGSIDINQFAKGMNAQK